ncbi:MAG TPA: hypothetical protein VNR18_04630 [Hyphomicrobiales bacterium]|nr:hypothetical protein [Hyphomicrobiales bacterium]
MLKPVSRLALPLLLACGSANLHAADACDRGCLETIAEQYLDAVVAADPARAPLAPEVRFTEDGQRLVPGDGLWNTLKAKGSYRLFVTDVPAGQVTLLATIEEDHRDPAQATSALLALRLKVANGRISEVEQMVVRDENAARRVAALSQPDSIYLQSVPEAERLPRATLIEVADAYFTGMQQNDGKGDYPFADDCNRLENGMQTTNAPTPAGEVRPSPSDSTSYSAQWSCMEQFKSGLLHFVNRIRDRRYVAVDQERGLVFAFAFFDHSGGEHRNFATPDGRNVTAGPVQPWTWEIAEVFKIENGLIHRIEALLQRSPYGMNSGWSSWEDGMSDLARDVTME